MNCTVCGSPLHAGRAVFRCSCGAVSHSHCWEKHVLGSHKPLFTIGTITMDGEFVPRTSEPIQGAKQGQESELVALKGGK
jgi:hypothetical protein